MESSAMTGFVICYLLTLIGLSLVTRTNMWERWVISLLKKEEYAVFCGCFTFLTGAIIVINHNIWEMSPIVLITAMGWVLLLDTALLLLKPNWIAKLTPTGSLLRKIIRIKGIIGTIIFALLMIYIWPDVYFF